MSSPRFRGASIGPDQNDLDGPITLQGTSKNPKNHPKLIYLSEKNHSFDRLRILPFTV